MSRLGFALRIVFFLTLLFFIFRAVFLLIYLDYFSELGFGGVAMAFMEGVRFDLSVFLTFTAFPLLFISWPAKAAGPVWVRFWSLLILLAALVMAGILAGDIVYFDYVKRHMANELLLAMDDFEFIVDMVLGEYLFLVPLFLAVLYFSDRVMVKLVRGIDYEKRSMAAFVFFFIFLALAVRGSFSDKPINVIDAFASGNTKQANLTLNGLFTTYHYSRKSGKFAAENFFSKEELAAILKLPERPSPEFPYEKTAALNGTKRNVVFVLMESWSAKYIDAVAHGGYGVTPNFDALAKEGRLFTNFYATGQRSIQGIQATLTSIPPFNGLPSIGHGLEVYKISKVAEMARNSGYATLFVQSSKRRSFRIDAIADALGFEHYFGMEDIPLRLAYDNPEASKFGWDYESYMFLKEKIDGLNEPFFTYMFTGTTHVPYAKLPDQFHKYPHDTNGQNGFLNTLYYSDWALGEFMNAAKTAPWYANTVFVFTADHTLGSSDTDTFLDRFHVPLLIFVPGGDPGVDTRTASHLDLMPTLAEMTGFEGRYSAFGTSLLGEEPATALITEANSIALVKPEGYLRHSLGKVLDTNLSGEVLKKYEEELLGNYQLINALLKANRWAR